MGVARIDIELQRNADYTRQWTFVDSDDQPLDLTGITFALDVKYNGGASGAALASATFTMIDALGGTIEVNIEGQHFSAVPGKQERVVLAYDCLMTQDGDDIPIARGAFILVPGVS